MAYTLISTYTASNTVSTITFSGIPSTYYDLAIVFDGKQTNAVINEQIWIRYNSLTSGFGEVGSYVNPTAAGAFLGDRTDYWYKNNYMSGAGSASNQFSSACFYLHSYSATGYRRTYLGQSPSQYYTGTTMRAGLVAGINSNTTALSSITIIGGSGDYITDTRVSLYGIA